MNELIAGILSVYNLNMTKNLLNSAQTFLLMLGDITYVLPDHTWSWWTSCWSVETRSGRGWADSYAGSVSSTGGRCAAALASPVLQANRTLLSMSPPQHPPHRDPCRSQPERPNQRTRAGWVRLTTQLNLVSPCLWSPTLLLHRHKASHKDVKAGADRVHKDPKMMHLLLL